MIFKLNKIKKKNKNQFIPQSQIIEFVYCDKCDTREKSRLSVGFTLKGCQIFCSNCNKNILHFELHGEMLCDPHPQGRFNKRAKHKDKETKNDYIISSEGLDVKRIEELTGT